MKKFVKWFLFSVVVLGSLALLVCYLTIPERTKDAIDIVIGYLNTPIGIGCGASITVGVVLAVVAKIFAKYLINNNQINLNTHKEKMDELVNKAKDYENKANTYYENTKVILGDFSAKVDEMCEKIIKVCETSPNAKVKALGVEFKNKIDNINEEIKQDIDKIDKGLSVVIEKKPKVEELENKVNELAEQIERLVNQYGEREERVND